MQVGFGLGQRIAATGVFHRNVVDLTRSWLFLHYIVRGLAAFHPHGFGKLRRIWVFIKMLAEPINGFVFGAADGLGGNAEELGNGSGVHLAVKN